MVGLLLWITHCWCCVFLMCNDRALKSSVDESNLDWKPNAEHLGQQLMYENVLESIVSTF